MTTEETGGGSFLNIQHVDKWYGEFNVLSNVSLRVDRGDVVCIIGPSGSGKSTLLRCVSNLEQIDGGRILLGDELIGIEPHKDGFARLTSSDAARQRQRFGFVFQQFQLFPHMTAYENVTVGPSRVKRDAPKDISSRADEILGKVGLKDKSGSYPSELSGGQQQRVGIARALAMNPDVLLFDEPTSALDPELVGEVLRTINDLAAMNHTMLVVTHQLEFARKIADTVVFFDRGTIIERGPPSEILEAPHDPRTRSFLAAVQTEG